MSIFGTDGIRGLVNEYPMTPEIAMKIALIIGNLSIKDTEKSSFNRVIVGKDTRRSCYMLEAVITAGLTAAGVDVILTGPIPTPAISMLTKSLRASYGIMISASHNPYQDNGIKIFNSEGLKISNEEQQEIEKLLTLPHEKFYTESKNIGKVRRLDDVIGRYIEHVKSSIPKYINFQGVKVVLDVANGAAYKIAPEILVELGAEVEVLNNEPNGENINNNCGSTCPEIISSKVKELGFDIGIAIDGDADRLIICDENGDIIDGDYIIGIIAKQLLEEKKLSSDIVVLTVLANSGLESYLANIGLKTIRTAVGDRNVTYEMLQVGSNLGGEQSGHIILADYSKTGDGILAAIQVLSYIVKNNIKASMVGKMFNKLPQSMVNIKFDKSKKINLNSEDLQKFILECNNALGEDGRLIVRKSGTENLIRIMVESKDIKKNQECTEKLKVFFESYTQV